MTPTTPSRRCARRCRSLPAHTESSELLERIYYDARRFQSWTATTASASRRPRARAGAHRLPLQARAAGRGRAGRPRRGPARSTTRSRRWSRRAGPPPRSWSSCTWAATSTPSSPSCASGSWASSSEPPARAPASCWSWRRCTVTAWATAIRPPSTCTRCWRSSPRTRWRWRPTPSTSARRATGWRWPTCSSSRSSARAPPASPSRSWCRGWRRSPPSPRSSWVTPSARWPPGSAPRSWRPRFSRAREAQRRILLKAKSWDRLAALLEREALAQTDAANRIDILRRVAQLHREKLGNAKRAIEIYREVLRADPQRRRLDARAGRDLRARGRLQGAGGGAARADRPHHRQARAGRACSAACWSSTTSAPAIWCRGSGRPTRSCRRCPGDRDTLVRLERILERAGQPADLVHVLDMHAKHAANPDEKLQLYRRIAEILYTKLQDPTGAAARLEEVARLDPDDAKALAGAAADLHGAETPRRAGPRAGHGGRARRRRRLRAGRVPAAAGAPGRGDHRRPRRAPARRWEQLSDLLPTDAEALDALARLYTAEEDWPMLVRILERQVPLAAEPDRAVALTLQRAQLFDEKLRDVDAAHRDAGAADRRGRPAQRRGARAPARLLRARRGLAARRQDRRAAAVPDRGPPRAHAALDGAGRADARSPGRREEGHHDLRARAGDGSPSTRRRWRRWRASTARPATTSGWPTPTRSCSSATEELRTRGASCCCRSASIYEKHLGEPARGFEWFRRAYTENPTAENLQVVDAAAERHGLFEELIQIYEGARERAAEPIEQLAASLKIALICEEKLDDPARAFPTLVDALPPIRRATSCCTTSSGWPSAPATGRACWTSTRRWRARGPKRKSASSCCACAPTCARSG